MMDKFQRKPVAKSNLISGSIGESRAKLIGNKTGVKVFKSEETDEKVNCDSPKLMKRNSGAGLNNKRKTWPHPAQIATIKPDSSSLVTKSSEIEKSSYANEKQLIRSSERDEMGNFLQVAVVSEDIGICEEKQVVIVDEIDESANLENGKTEDNGKEECIKPDDKCTLEISNTPQETPNNRNEKISPSPNKLAEPKKQQIITQLKPGKKVNLHSINKKLQEESIKSIPPSRCQSKLQNLVDLVMWVDVSRSAFIFGIGTFLIASSSYTDALNISFISAVSYMGLVYLATRYLYNSLISKVEYTVDEHDVVGEDEAARFIRSVIPFVNEFLLSTKALFSGDPTTTIKMSVILFLLAQCGSSITIWALFKLAFFGVFTLPKFFSIYSTSLSAHGKFWFQRFRDVWNGCPHKKAVAFAAFTCVWNFTSSVTRVWALFMTFVAFRYYKEGTVG